MSLESRRSGANMRLIGFLVLLGLGGVCALESLVCLKNHTVLEMSGDAVLSVFIETDYGPECNISSPKSVQEVATALFVAQSLNKMEYVPGVTIGLRLYDTCNDRISVYKQALISAVEMDCSAHYDLGILAPERYLEVLEPLRSLDLLPVNTYGPANLALPLVDVLVDFLSTRYSHVDQLLADSRPVLDRFVQQTKQAGICLRKDKDFDVFNLPNNQTERLLVAVGNFDDISVWLGELNGFVAEFNSVTWVVLPLDNSHVDDLLPEGSFVIRPEQFVVELGPDLEASDLSQIPVNTLLRSPHLLSVGKAVLEIASQLRQVQSKSCGSEVTGCVLPRFEWTKQDPMSNADLYEILKVPAMAHSTRYVVARKVDGAMEEVTAYKIDATSARYRAIAEKELPRVPRLCVKKLAKNCEMCANFQILEPEDTDDGEEEIGLMKPHIWVPIFLTIVALGCITCIGVLVFIVYRFYVEEILDGNPSFTLILIGATMMLLLSLVLFCLEDKTVGASSLNAWKIYTTTLSFGLVFSIMLTRALFLSFSTTGVFHTQHINGYLQSFMLFFMASVEFAISTMYFAFSTSNAAHVMRSPSYVGLLSYDIFLLLLTFIACSFTAQIHRNYREGTCFFGTAIGLLICWAVWVTCFALLSADKRDLIVCFGILSTACLIIVGILVPRTYFMYERFSREKNLVGRFEVTDLGPDPRMNTTARQVLDSQSRQAFYEYVSPEVQTQQQQAAMSSVAPNYYGASSLNPIGRLSLRQRSPEPRRTPGYNNYGFVRPEMREVDPASSPYGAPRLYVDETDGQAGPSMKSVSSASTAAAAGAAVPEARYALPRSLLRKVRGSIKRTVRPGSAVVETEVHAAPGRVSPTRSGRVDYLSPGPPRSHSPSNLSFNRVAPDEHPTRVTRF